MACQSTGDGCAGTQCYQWQFPVHDIPDDNEVPVFVVAPTSRGLCVSQWDRNGKVVVYNLLGLVGEGDCAKDWRCETLPTSRAILFGADFRRLHARMSLEPHRTGAGDTDVYCVALKDSMFGRVFCDNVRLLLVFKSLKHLLNIRFELFVSLLFSDFQSHLIIYLCLLYFTKCHLCDATKEISVTIIWL